MYFMPHPVLSQGLRIIEHELLLQLMLAILTSRATLDGNIHKL